MKSKKIIGLLLLALLCLSLSACRVRTTGQQSQAESQREETAGSEHASDTGSSAEEASDQAADTDQDQKDEVSGARTKENPEASRKEYDENAPAEILPGTDRELHGAGEGNGAPVADTEAALRVNRLEEQAEELATQTIAAEQAEQKGVSEDAEEADSALTYFTVLLQDRMGSLFECQRLDVYWETAEDHVTVYKASPEHHLILEAGAYDVSSRLLEENLHVDDGWVYRKNPGVIVKIVDRNVLGSGVSSTGAAQRVLSGLLARENWAQIDAVRNKKVLLLSEELLEAPHLQVAAMLLIAKTANPDLFTDTDPDQAIRMLSEEAIGTAPEGVFFYSGEGGF